MKIQERIINVMKAVGFIGKDRKAPGVIGGFNFRGIDDFLGAMHDPLADNGLFVLPTVVKTTREERANKEGKITVTTLLDIRYDIHSIDGEVLSATVIGEGSDGTDKGCSKAMSTGFKTFFAQGFCIPTDEPELDVENDPQPDATVAKKETKPKESKTVEKPEDNGKEWYTTLKNTLEAMCLQESPQAVCESLLLMDKLTPQLPEDKPAAAYTLVTLLAKRGVKMGKAGPVGLTDAIGQEIMDLIGKYDRADEAA